MKPNWPWHHPDATDFVALSSKRCAACWECIAACPNGVLGRVVFLWHRHVRLDQPDACTGCQKCVRSCKEGALVTLARGAHPRNPRLASVDHRAGRAGRP